MGICGPCSSARGNQSSPSYSRRLIFDLGGGLRPFAFSLAATSTARNVIDLAGVGEELDDGDERFCPGVDAVALLDLTARLALAVADDAAIESCRRGSAELDARFAAPRQDGSTRT